MRVMARFQILFSRHSFECGQRSVRIRTDLPLVWTPPQIEKEQIFEHDITDFLSARLLPRKSDDRQRLGSSQ
jgi:hypothetical protein